MIDLRKVGLWALALAAVFGGYQGWAYHQRALGKLEVAVADDVRVAKVEKMKDAALVTVISAQRDSALKAGNMAVIRERRRTAAILGADSAAALTDSTLHHALAVIHDSTTTQLLDSVGVVVRRERAARALERAESDSTINAWKTTALRWRLSSDSTGALAGSRLRRIDALTAENAAVRRLLPSKIGGAAKVGSAIVVTVLACRYVVHC